MIILDDEGKRVTDEKQGAVGTTAVYFLLDQSGSMGFIKQDTIGGFNAYIEGLKNSGLDFQFTLVLFDTQGITTRHKSVALSAVTKLDDKSYVPGAGTNLYDAIGGLLRDCSQDVAEKHLVVIMTDGEENSSVEFNLEKINTMITEYQAKGWDFVYLGANHDAWQAGSKMGMSSGNTMSYEVGAMGQSMRNLASVTNRYASKSGQSKTVFEDAQLKEEDFEETK